MQARTDGRLTAIHGGFGQSTLTITSGVLLGQSVLCLDHVEMTIPLCQTVVRQLHRGNAVAERFFLNLKMKRVWQRTYRNQAEAKRDVTDVRHLPFPPPLPTVNGDLKLIQFFDKQ